VQGLPMLIMLIKAECYAFWPAASAAQISF